jgi:hypothetical protein
VAAMTAAAGTVFAGGANPNFTLPLHAKVTQVFEPCDGYLPVDCLGVHPTVEVQSGQAVAVFLLVANAPELTGVQTAFDIDPTWTFVSDAWDCRGRYAFVPVSPFYPNSNTLAVTFNCITGGELLPIGRMFFIAGTGCIGQVSSTFPFGTHVLDCQGEADMIVPSQPGQAARLGKVCVGTGGNDACAVATPVAAATWGQIKKTYQ